jgi:rsbT antagonist protein RsbS
VSSFIPILRFRDTLVASIQSELRDAIADQFQMDVLAEIERTSAGGLIVDISGVEVVDSYVAQVLANTGKMARLMGTRTVLVGMRPEVAATLVRMGFTFDLETALNLEEGFDLLSGSGDGDGGANGKS